jgi:protein O-mannosyl-transferase
VGTRGATVESVRTRAAAEPAGRASHWWLPALLAVAIGVTYANSLHVPFQFDDWHVLEQNPHIRTLRTIPRFFTDANVTTVLPYNRDLRPILMVTFALNYAISGDATWSWHLFNMVLHWIAALLVFRIVRDHLWLGDEAPFVAGAAALIVAVHPLNTETLDYLSARSALLTTVFYLGAFDAALRRRTAACLGLFALAMLTKAIAFTLPITLLAYVLVDRSVRPAARRAPFPWPLLAGVTAVAAAGIAYRVLLVPRSALESTHQAGITPWVYFMTEWSAYLYYLRLFVFPNALVADRLDYPYATSILQFQAWGSLAALVVITGLAFRAGRYRPALTFAWLWYLITLAAESSFFPLAEPVNEHRPYLAMLGLGVAAAVGLWEGARGIATRRQAPAAWLFAVVVAVVASACAAVAVARNRDWQDAYALWVDATKKAPANARAWLNAGHAAMGKDRLDEARTFLLEGHRLSPCYAYLQMNLSALDAREGKFPESLKWADEAVRCNPGLALTHHYRAAALERLKRPDPALDEYRQVTKLDPLHADAWFAQGRLLEEKGRFAEAAAAFDHSLAANPRSSDAAMRAGLLLQHHLGDPGAAVDRYRTVLALAPRHYGAHYQIATALLATGRTAEAKAAWAEFVPLAEAIRDKATLDGAPAALKR